MSAGPTDDEIREAVIAALPSERPTLPPIPDAAVEALLHSFSRYPEWGEADVILNRKHVEAVWPHLYAAALRHAADRTRQAHPDYPVATIEDLNRWADEAVSHEDLPHPWPAGGPDLEPAPAPVDVDDGEHAGAACRRFPHDRRPRPRPRGLPPTARHGGAAAH